MLGTARLPLRGLRVPSSEVMSGGCWGRRLWGWAMPLLVGAVILGVLVLGCEDHFLKMLERCGITPGTLGNPLVRQPGPFLLPVPHRCPRGEVKVLSRILGILLLIRFLGPARVSSFAEDKAQWHSSRNKPVYLNIYLPIIK